MRKTLHTENVIRAPARRVWELLVDFQGYRRWNPFIPSVRGMAEVGQWLEVVVQAPGGRPHRLRPTVVTLRPERELGWIARFARLPGVFDGEHSFVVEPLEQGSVRFVHTERFVGILVPFVWPFIAPRTRAGFEAMNRALRHQAEQD